MLVENPRKPLVVSFFDEKSFTATHVVADTDSKVCAVIDPVMDFCPNSGRCSAQSADRIIELINTQGFRVEWILETHVHADHLSAAPYLTQRIGGRIAIGGSIKMVQKKFGIFFNAGADFALDGSQFDTLLNDGDKIRLGNLIVTAIHTPGHTPACMTYLIGDTAFVGDTLFMPDYGTARCDFPGGDAATLYRSIQKIFALPDTTRIFLCHDYLAPGRANYAWETTVLEQRKHNIHVRDGISETEFVAMRTARDKTLSLPNLFLHSVQVNMRAGHFPPAETNGVRYLKLPLNVI